MPSIELSVFSSLVFFTAFIQSDTILEVLHFGEGSLLQVSFARLLMLMTNTVELKSCQ